MGIISLDLEKLKEMKLAEISQKHAEAVAGSVDVSLGFPMQFNQKDVWAVKSAIELADAMGQETIYLTDSENVNHENISLEQAKIVLLEMGQAHLATHQKKQALRAQVNDGATDTVEKVQAIQW